MDGMVSFLDVGDDKAILPELDGRLLFSFGMQLQGLRDSRVLAFLSVHLCTAGACAVCFGGGAV